MPKLHPDRDTAVTLLALSHLAFNSLSSCGTQGAADKPTFSHWLLYAAGQAEKRVSVLKGAWKRPQR